MILCVSSIGLVIFIFSLLFVILTMDTLSKINLMDGWMDIITLSEEARTVAIYILILNIEKSLVEFGRTCGCEICKWTDKHTDRHTERQILITIAVYMLWRGVARVAAQTC